MRAIVETFCFPFSGAFLVVELTFVLVVVLVFFLPLCLSCRRNV